MKTEQIVHLLLLIVLLAGTVFAWYNSAKELGIIPCETVCSASAAMGGIPICVLGAIFFTIALVLAAILWLMKK